jgi:uncharacterized protein
MARRFFSALAGMVVLSAVSLGLGSSAPAVASAQVIAPQPVGPRAIPLDSLLKFVFNDVNAYWTDVFRRQGLSYTPARAVVFSDRGTSPCGPLVPGRTGPMYCDANQTEYLDEQFLDDFQGRYGDFAAATIIAHETGHHVQWVLGVTRPTPRGSNRYYTVQIELEADCFAGSWARSEEDQDRLDPGDIEGAYAGTWNAGDPAGTPIFDVNAHGDGSLRTGAFMLGYTSGNPAACNQYL